MISKRDTQIKNTTYILFLILNITAINTNMTWYVDKQINILLWIESEIFPFTNMLPEKMQKCLFRNCFATKNKLYFSDETYFDVLLFNVVDLYRNMTLPKKRLDRQKYIFVSREPPALFTPSPQLNGYFNLTWTYKSHSDITLRYVIVKDRKGNVIGPSENVPWMDINAMKPVSKKIKRKLQSKYLPVAWLVSHCYTPNKRELFVQALQDELINYQLQIDIFGRCKENLCAEDEEQCHAMIETNYYFYLAFENSFCDEYVTEKLLTATKHLTVPIVFGGADYSRLVIFKQQCLFSLTVSLIALLPI